MTGKDFVNKWRGVTVKEIAAYQSHFIDLCALVGHKTPIEVDPHGEFFTFEMSTEKATGKMGRADVWYKNKFILEYKKWHANLDKAYQQLLLYRESLGNPPLLVTSDTEKIIIHTNFTNTVKKSYVLTFDDIENGNGIDTLRNLFYNPDIFKPTQTQEQVTQITASSFIDIADTLRNYQKLSNNNVEPEIIGHFIVRLLFCLFAEDIGILPEGLLSQIVNTKSTGATELRQSLMSLFEVMKTGGQYGSFRIPHINGGLFEDNFVPELDGRILYELRDACTLDWSAIDPTIFGTLFERIIDQTKRSQLGLHYTSKEDIRLVTEPVVYKPFYIEWLNIKLSTEKLIQNNQINEVKEILTKFSIRLSSIKILDPACGSGNFLYVSLQQLLNLQKEVVTFAGLNGIELELTVNPSQLYGIEINPYAYELAQITTWIGYLQWRFENGFSDLSEPILQPLHNIEHKDAILSHDEQGNPIEPDWANVDIIVGNPPFLGSRKMKSELSEKYCNELNEVYSNKIEGLPDLVCYWFYKSWNMVKCGITNRVGLLATQAIRGGTNRKVLDNISKDGNIFLAWSDREWILEGATVHVSIIGFDKGLESEKTLNGLQVSHINPDLTSDVDVTIAKQLKENSGISFQGVVLRGAFNISNEQANEMLKDNSNTAGYDNSKIIKQRRTGDDLLNKRDVKSYVIDYGIDMPISEAQKFVLPFRYLKENVYPDRQKANQPEARDKWWIHWNTRDQMRLALGKVNRYVATPRVAKHRLFIWVDSSILPDAQLVVFSRSDDYFLGVLQSNIHEVWARRKGTQLRDAESGFRYTSETTFETFPMPWHPGKENIEDERHIKISNLAKHLDNFRNSWLYPSQKEIQEEIGGVSVEKRTLTVLYNALEDYKVNYYNGVGSIKNWNKKWFTIVPFETVTELNAIHNKLDGLVAEAYGWSYPLSETEILSRLLALNQQRN